MRIIGLPAGGAAAEVAVELLVWGRPLPVSITGAFDFLLASDVCYDSDCYDDLLSTISDLCARNNSMQVLFWRCAGMHLQCMFGVHVWQQAAWLTTVEPAWPLCSSRPLGLLNSDRGSSTCSREQPSVS